MRNEVKNKIDRDLFKDMPGALRSEDDIRDEKINRGVKRLFTAAIIATASAYALSFFFNADNTTDPAPDETTEQTINTSPAPD